MDRPILARPLCALFALLLVSSSSIAAPQGAARNVLETWMENSVGDLARYGLAHLAGLSGQDGFLKAATIQELHRVAEGGASYAAGWRIDPESGQHRHNGSAGTFFSLLTIDPQARLVVAFLTNASPAKGQPAAERAVGAILDRHAGR